MLRVKIDHLCSNQSYFEKLLVRIDNCGLRHRVWRYRNKSSLHDENHIFQRIWPGSQSSQFARCDFADRVGIDHRCLLVLIRLLKSLGRRRTNARLAISNLRPESQTSCSEELPQIGISSGARLSKPQPRYRPLTNHHGGIPRMSMRTFSPPRSPQR